MKLIKECSVFDSDLIDIPPIETRLTDFQKYKLTKELSFLDDEILKLEEQINTPVHYTCLSEDQQKELLEEKLAIIREMFPNNQISPKGCIYPEQKSITFYGSIESEKK